MPAKLELVTSLLDTFAFFLVTPEVLGKERFLTWFAKGGKVNTWIRTIWFNRELGQMNLGSITSVLVLLILLPLVLGGINLPTPYVLALWLLPTLGPAAFVLLYLAVAQLAQPFGIVRALAVGGAILFLLARALTIASAWRRL